MAVVFNSSLVLCSVGIFFFLFFVVAVAISFVQHPASYARSLSSLFFHIFLRFYTGQLSTLHTAMSGLKNSPFGKRLRASHQDVDDEAPSRNRPKYNPIFGTAPLSTPSLDSSRPSTGESSAPSSPESRSARDYNNRCVPVVLVIVAMT